MSSALRRWIAPWLPAGLRRRLGAWGGSLRRLPDVAARLLAVLGNRRPPGPAAAVFYGEPQIPDLGQPTHGGLIKVQRMQRRFPNSPGAFNTLYLVSSALPPGAAWLARAARARSARLVLNQNGVAYPGWSRDWRAMNALMRRVLRAADHVFYQSEFCKRAADEFLGEPPCEWEILYNAVDTATFTAAPADPAPGRLVLMLGGTQDQEYRVSSALRTLSRVVELGWDARLLVTGRLRWREEHAARQATLALIAELRLEQRVELVGPYAQQQAPELLRRAHILLHTKYNDPSPGLVVEAMACGLPVVYSASGGVPELVGEHAGAGVRAPAGFAQDVPPDPEALAQAVVRVARERAAFSQAARRRSVEKFELGDWLRRHEEVFARLLR